MWEVEISVRNDPESSTLKRPAALPSVRQIFALHEITPTRASNYPGDKTKQLYRT